MVDTPPGLVYRLIAHQYAIYSSNPHAGLGVHTGCMITNAVLYQCVLLDGEAGHDIDGRI